MSLESAEAAYIEKNERILKKFFDFYSEVFKQYMEEYVKTKQILVEDKGLDVDTMTERLFFEILGIEKNDERIFRFNDPNDPNDFAVLTNDDLSSLSQDIDSIEDTVAGWDVDINNTGSSLHNNILNRVVGLMKGSSIHKGYAKEFNFFELQWDAPEIYEALIFGLENKYFSIESDFSHIALMHTNVGGRNNRLAWNMTIDEFNQFLDKPLASGSINPNENKLLTLLENSVSSTQKKLIPQFTFKLVPGPDLNRIVANETFTFLSSLKNIGGIPAGVAVGQMNIYTNPSHIATEGSIKYLLGTLFNLDRSETDNLDITDSALTTIFDEMNIADNHVYFEWDFVNPASADGFATLLNDTRVDEFKVKVFPKFIKNLKPIMQHFKSHKVPITAMAAPGMPHLISLYQSLGGMLLPTHSEYKNMVKQLIGQTTVETSIEGGGSMNDLQILILPDYIDNDKVVTKVFKPETSFLKDERFVRLTKEASWIDNNGVFRKIGKGAILTPNQFRYIKKLAKETGGAIPEKTNIGRYTQDVAMNYLYQRFNNDDLGYIMNSLKVRQELRGADGNRIINPALGYERKKVRYKDLTEWKSNKPTHYSQFYADLRKAMAATNYEEQFLRNALKVFLGGEYYDTEGKLLAIPANDKNGFIFLNTANKNADDMWNMLFVLKGNSNVLPDIFFGGRIGNVTYTEELRKRIRNLDKGNIQSLTNGSAVAKVLEIFNDILPGTTLSEPPSGFPTVSGADLQPGTVYKLGEIAEHNPQLIYELYTKFDATDLFQNLPAYLQSNLALLKRLIDDEGIDIFGDMRIDMPDLTQKTKDLTKSIIENLKDLDGFEDYDLDDLEQQVDLTNLQNARPSGTTATTNRNLRNAAGIRASSRPRSVTGFDNLEGLIDNEEAPAWLQNPNQPESVTTLSNSAYAIDSGVQFFDLSQYDDYRISVMGLTQGNSFMDGMNYDEALNVVNEFVTSDPENRFYAYKLLQRGDGTTVIPFVNENTKDIFKRNLLVANRILQQEKNGIIVPYGFNSGEHVLNRPKAKIVHLDVAPVQTYPPVNKQGIHVLEFDIGMAEVIDGGNSNGTFTRHYTQVAFSYDANTGELKIHHWVDNLPVATLDGVNLDIQKALVPQYAVKDSAIIKSLMEIYGITDENKVIDGDTFLLQSEGVSLGNAGPAIPTLKVLPGRIAKSFGYLQEVDTDPDASMYSKTWGETIGTLLRNRKVHSLFGFNEKINMPITDAFLEVEEALLDADVRLDPIMNNPISVQTGVTIQPFKNEEISFLLNDVLDELQGFKHTQDNMGGFKFGSVDFVLESNQGNKIYLTANMDINGVLTNIMYDSPDYEVAQVSNIIDEHIKNVFTPEQIQVAKDRNQNLRKDFWLHPVINPQTGKKEFVQVVNSIDNEIFVVKKVQFTGSSYIKFTGDADDAIDFNNIMKDKGFRFTRTTPAPDGTIDTYNPFITQVMEAEPIVTGSSSTNDIGVQYNELQNRNARLWQNTQSHTTNGDSWTHDLYPVGNNGDPNRINYTTNVVANSDAPNTTVSGWNNGWNGLRRHSRVTADAIGEVAKLSPSIFKLAFKPVGGVLKLLEKIDFADKIVMKSIKPVSGLLAKGVSKIGGRTAIAALGGAAAASTIGVGLATVYAAAEIGALVVGLVKEGDLLSDTQKLMKELRDDNPGDGAWKRFWTSTGKNVWKGLEWQEDHSLSGLIGKKMFEAVGYGVEEGVGLYNQKYNKNKQGVLELAKYAANNTDIFDNVNTYDPKYNEQFDSINNNFSLSQQKYGTENYKKNMYEQMRQINNFPLWQKNDELLYNGNKEYLTTVDNYIKLATEFESIGY